MGLQEGVDWNYLKAESKLDVEKLIEEAMANIETICL